MTTNFGGNFPVVRKVSQRDRLMFLAVVGLVVSLVLLIFVFSKKHQATHNLKEISSNSSANAAIGTLTLYASDKIIPKGSKLSSFKFKPVYWPRNSVPDGAVRDLSELRGMFAKIDIPTEVPIQRVHLTKEVSTQSLPIIQGMRAVTIPVNDQSGIEGWAQPGAKVDVVLTYLQEGELKSKIIVENARVLSLGGDSRGMEERLGKLQRAESQRTLTLEVTPQDALKVQTSLQLGKLALIMRAVDDNKTLNITEVTGNQIDGSQSSSASSKRTCSRGTMRVGGKEYLIDCDGSLTPVANPDQP